jgi:hypothetical protein
LQYYRNHSHCKICEQERARANKDKRKIISDRWAKNNPDKVKASVKKWKMKNLDKVRENSKRWQRNNRQKAKDNSKRWRSKNPAKVKAMHDDWLRKHPERKKIYYDRSREMSRKWWREHQDKAREYSRKQRITHSKERKLWRENNRERLRGYDKKRRSTIFGKLNDRMSVSVWQALRKNKNGYRWEKLVGYNLPELKEHLESKFVDGMTWKNIGEWHIDHIVPKSRFHYQFSDDPEFKICWSLANLQPMWKSDNLSKHSKTMEEWEKYKQTITGGAGETMGGLQE